MPVAVTKAQIDSALPRIEIGLHQYLWLQSAVGSIQAFHRDPEFRRRYNHFYRVRRSAIWRDAFYELMDRAMREQLNFDAVLCLLHESTDRYETSFASKLIATLSPSSPVIDSIVLRNVGLQLPARTVQDRVRGISAVYRQLGEMFADFARSETGHYLKAQFNRVYPKANITVEKQIDLVLWQTRT